MPRTKEPQWTVSKIIEYAAETYPNVAAYLIKPHKKEKDKDTYDLSGNMQDAYRKRILRELEAHHIVETKPDDNMVTTSSDRSGTNQKRLLVPESFAKYLVENKLRDYFLEETPEKVAANMQKEYETGLAKLQEKSKPDDDALSSRDEALTILADISQTYEQDDDTAAFEEAIEAWRKDYPEIANEYDDHVIHKSYYEYHIPAIVFEDFSPSFEDEVIDCMMLRCLFHLFFDFDEKRFRKDLVERALCICPDRKTYTPGFSELTKNLENPIGKYVFLKKRFEDKDKKKKEKDEKKQDKDEEKKE